MESLGDILRNMVASRQANQPDRGEPEPEPAEKCPVCHDAGFVHPAPGGRPDYSRVVPCDCATARPKDGRLDFLQRYSNLGPLAGRTFDNFLCQPASGGPLAAAVAAARAFAEKPDGWLVLVGPSGSGKTHLAAAIAGHRLALGHPAAFTSISDLLDHLRATYHPSSAVSYDSLFEKVRNAPLLVLDDLGHQSSTTWSTEKLDQIINHRFVSRLPTVFTTSFSPDELEERWGTRLRDPRLSRIIFLTGPDEGQSEDIEAMAHLRHMTFETFRWKRAELLLEDRQALEAAFNNALEFARQPDGWLVLEGVHGCGKTHLAAAIANYRLRQGKPARFMLIPDLLDLLRATFNSDSRSSYKVFDQIKNAPLLVLDDLGGNTTTPWAQEKLFQLINHRYAARLPTVFTIARREELDERLRSRLDDASLVISSPAMKRPFYVSEEPSGKSLSPPPPGSPGKKIHR